MMTGITTERTWTVRLTDSEREGLLELLAHALKTLGVELHRTDSLSYREMLRHKEEFLTSLCEKLRHASD
jgi:hypothetical protein